MYNIIKIYFELIKPRIVFANLIAVVGGFFLASVHKINFYLLFYLLLSTFCIISSSCVFNNIIDSDIDKKMHRTSKRVLTNLMYSILHIKIYGIFLFLLGVFLFFIKINILCLIFSIVGFLVYVVVYSLYMKRISQYAIIVGSISGSIPPILGYCAVSNAIDIKFLTIFLLYTFWQIPHSYSILIIYNKDYRSANIPTFVIKNGILKTIKSIILYILCFYVCVILSYYLKFFNSLFFIILSVLIFMWLFLSIFCYIRFFYYKYYIKLVFFLSILIILIFNFIIIISSIFKI